MWRHHLHPSLLSYATLVPKTMCHPYQKHKLLHDLASAHDKIILLQDKLEKEYGSYDVNLEDGTINWPTSGRDTFLDNEK